MLFQATSGTYVDMQPVFIPFVCRLVFELGGSLSLIILTQAVAGLLGVRALIIESLRFFEVEEERARDWFTLLVLVLLSLPLTPLSVYLVTLWTDTWLCILLLWIVALFLKAYNVGSKPIARNVWIACGLLGLAMLARYNAIVVYPAAILTAWMILPGWRLRILAALIPLAICGSFRAYESRVLQPTRWHVENGGLALDLASMVVTDPSICRNLSLTSCYLIDGVFPPEFVVGDGAIDYSFNQGSIPVAEEYGNLFWHPTLLQEYFIAARDYPLLFARVKILNFLDYVGPDPTRYFYQKHPSTTKMYDVPAERLPQQHSAWFELLDAVKSVPILNWFGFVHASWLIVNLAGLAACGWLAKRDARRARFLACVLLMPAAYYGSYLLLLTSSEFRFMYPSMLLMQVLTLAALAGWLAKRRARSLHVSRLSEAAPVLDPP